MVVEQAVKALALVVAQERVEVALPGEVAQEGVEDKVVLVGEVALPGEVAQEGVEDKMALVGEVPGVALLGVALVAEAVEDQ